MDDGVEEILARYDSQVRDLTVRSRALIEDAYPDVIEVPWPRQNVAGYGVGPTPDLPTPDQERFRRGAA